MIIDMLSNLGGILASTSILYMLFGVVLGLIFGAIPGLTATLAVVILIPLTYTLSTASGVSMLIGAYVGGISGGFVSAIMLNLPGTPSSIATTFDGFPMAQQGTAGKAMGAGIVSNLMGTLMGWLALLLFAPALSRVALSFGSHEYTTALLFGFTAVVALSGDNIVKGAIAGLLGLTLSLIGFDTLTGMDRATFGIPILASGVNYMATMIGVFVVAEVFTQIEEIAKKYVVPKQTIKNVLLTGKEFVQSIPNFIRSGLIGIGIGLLPGIGAAFANFVTYDQAKKASKDPDSFGKGNIQGVIASETGNNAVIGGALVPFVSLGIPGDVVTAALMGGLMIKGITPGPLLVKEHPDTVFTIYNSVFVSAILCFLIMFFIGVRVFPKALRIPKYILLPVVLIMAFIGTYNMNFSVNDVWITALMGIVGYLMSKLKIPKAPLIITMILGSNFETYLRTALNLSDGSLLPFVTRPGCLVFLGITIITILVPIISKQKRKRKASAAV